MTERNNTKFTPGPWNTATVIRNGKIFSAVIDQHLERLCTMPDFGAAAQANAVLIAAAPDLYADERKNQKFLACLRDFFAVMSEDADVAKIAGFADSMREWKELLDSRMAEITVLLAKARGEDEK